MSDASDFKNNLTKKYSRRALVSFYAACVHYTTQRNYSGERDPSITFGMHILGPVTELKEGNGFAAIIMDRYSKLKTAASTSEVNSMQTATLFLNHCIVPYGILVSLLTDSGARPSICHYVIRIRLQILRSEADNTHGLHPSYGRLVAGYSGTIFARIPS